MRHARLKDELKELDHGGKKKADRRHFEETAFFPEQVRTHEAQWHKPDDVPPLIIPVLKTGVPVK